MAFRIFFRSLKNDTSSQRNRLRRFWSFVRRHWFTVALGLLALLALWRRRTPPVARELIPITPTQEEVRRYTQHSESAAQKAFLLQAPAELAEESAVRLPAIDDATAVAFLQRFARTAIAEQERFGMPASILLACAYVNSFAGTRKCAKEANNYVALRCTADWSGSVASLDGVCYRRYNTAWESLRDFNAYYSRKAWYAELKKSASRDWRKWLKVLAAHEVSDVVNFEAEATRLITTFRVYELDEQTSVK
ncbi:MAG: glucosaminidase domain-containing protein [Saprospiraceae bacterium]|nr:glucosaminidase domain-containing protein [Saprospiraceae bacterium]MDW8483739.1 glucosaminidase domain-containing protein [Saprospiraceae bacterium]